METLPAGLWRRLRAEPDRAPEHLALAIAERFGPQAAQFAAMHAADRDPHRAAKLAKRKAVRKARLTGAATGLGGITTAALDLASLGWIQGRMVFFIAAAYGHDPGDPMRPAELLYLWGVYPSAEEARQGLDRAGRHMALAYAGNKLSDTGDGASAGDLAALMTRYFVKRTVIRAIPVVASPINAVANARATADLAKRAIKLYRG